MMMQIKEEKFGFVLDNVHFSKDADAEIYQFRHLQSGGALIWLKNADENRTFGIGFLTPPTDSTGVAHIVEHSVLSGSRKYPAKDPFMQMVKTSMNTFLNAMTFSDMTIYPVASMNEQDFHNLMDVYLDAVLFPRMHDEPNIFYQEGWHKEIFQTDEDLKYNGVVYNEMRGAYSTPDRIVSQQIDQTFHPGSTYAHESGGYPYAIPDLTYEDFKAFHAKHYRPENALTYLYGDVDIDRALEQINNDFFSKFTAKQGCSQLELPAITAKTTNETMYFDADDQMSPDSDSYLSYVLPFSQADDLFELYLLAIMSEALIDAEASPLRAQLVDAGYGQDISSLSADSYYLDFGLVLEHFDAGQRDEVIQIIDNTLNRVAAEGLNRDLLEAVINRNELEFRQAGGTRRGVMYFIQVMSAWRYGVSPSAVLDFSEIFAQLRDKLKTNYYEEIIGDRLLNPKAKQIIVHEPKTGIFSQLDAEVKEKLAAEKNQLSEAGLAELITQNDELRAYQLKEDDEAVKNTLPKLSISDVKRQITPIPVEEVADQHKVFFHPQPAAGIRYAHIAFPMDVLTADELSYAQDLMTLIGLVETEKYDYSTLDIELTKVTSGLSLRPKVYIDSRTNDEFSAQAILSFAALDKNSQRAFELVDEIIKHSKFDNQKRIKNILQRVKIGLEETFENAGHQMAISYLRSFYSQSAKYASQTNGLDYYDHLNMLLKDFESKFDDYVAKLKMIQAKMWHNHNVVVALAADAAARSEFVDQAIAFVDGLPNEVLPANTVRFDLTGSHREAITTNSNVQYVSVGGSLDKTDYEYDGRMVVLANILSKGYLHELIRAQGGAYGAGITLTENGDVTTYSYRDPNLTNTIEVYRQIGKALSGLDLSQDELDQYIIGSMNRFHFPIAAANVNSITLMRYFKGQTIAMVEEQLHQALATKVTDIVGYAAMLDEVIAQNNLVVFGNKLEIENNAMLFDKVRSLKQ